MCVPVAARVPCCGLSARGVVYQHVQICCNVLQVVWRAAARADHSGDPSAGQAAGPQVQPLTQSCAGAVSACPWCMHAPAMPCLCEVTEKGQPGLTCICGGEGDKGQWLTRVCRAKLGSVPV